MSEMIAKLENNLHRNRTDGQEIIQFESNPLLKGLNWIDPLYKAIAARRAVLIAYRSFRSRSAHEAIYYPFLLKEYRNRWFLIARNKSQNHLVTLALDRIEAVEELIKEPFVAYPEVDFAHYFDNVLGVTKSEKDQAVRVVLGVDRSTKPYILTKPLHASQTILKESEDRTIIQIEVVINFELEREILGFGSHVKVLSPRHLAKRIKTALQAAAALYDAADER